MEKCEQCEQYEEEIRELKERIDDLEGAISDAQDELKKVY